jgi:site-specific recombinase xerD
VFIEAVKTFPEYYHWYPLFATLLGTGMRIGECTGSNINFIIFVLQRGHFHNRIKIEKNVNYIG